MSNSKLTDLNGYSLKEQVAIDVINSKYTYEQVKYFIDIMHTILTEHDLCPLSTTYQLNEIIAFTHVMLKLIDSPRLIIEIQKLPEFELIDPEERTANERFNISAEQISLPIHIVEHLQWISYILQKKEISMLILLDEYFKKFSYINRS